ncbi:PAS-domain containing protein [Xinfangfangia sp. CPCC 101601]|uniref:PAS-domain containing protein n=1 Tax=Pseudogemmobacter lacusdianii TaxID=3069608 RepID=A0ABU0VTZ5_9RHOB|nr:PAS-domain containing protein [Xinfangfangia sp. CPCC 101601]MDQ2065201.1 PAS-domain containing protein [Xinfangfangia sp. CPCC 101601]
MDAELSFALGLVTTAILLALSGLCALAALAKPAGQNIVGSIFAQPTETTVFLFDGEDLVDATAAARKMLLGSEQGPWFDLLSRLEPMFPSFGLRIAGLQREGRFVLCSREDLEPPLVLRAEYLGGLARVTLIDADTEQRRPGRDAPTDIALQHELGAMRDVLARLPALVWRLRGDGQVIWANAAYLLAAAETLPPGEDFTWPLPRIFAPAELPKSGPLRQSVRLGGTLHWYELTAETFGDETLFFALPADRLVQSEVTLREFMQTLTKTFAQLPIGLAIFDRDRVLQLFNPALLDLTGLKAEFLISRPSLSAMLDAMRNSSMIPEPRDYRSWRKQMTAVEAAAAQGLYEEVWSLPSGQTWRVTGRPHPNGALAFLFEDISHEMMRTRRYRADLDLGLGVIDAMEDAIAVFSQDGNLAMTNRAYLALWGPPEPPPLGIAAKVAAVETWRHLTATTLLWNDLLAYIGALGERDPWEGELRLLDGRALTCRVSPLPHGATLVSFAAQKLGIEPRTDEDRASKAVLLA